MEYFNEVDKSAAMRIAHQIEPVACMTKFGLTAFEQDAIMSGDATRMVETIGERATEVGKLQIMHVPNTVFDDLH
jgi:hypothetical protein